MGGFEPPSAVQEACPNFGACSAHVGKGCVGDRGQRRMSAVQSAKMSKKINGENRGRMSAGAGPRPRGWRVGSASRRLQQRGDPMPGYKGMYSEKEKQRQDREMVHKTQFMMN